jgi:hypothetical protein
MSNKRTEKPRLGRPGKGIFAFRRPASGAFAGTGAAIPTAAVALAAHAQPTQVTAWAAAAALVAALAVTGLREVSRLYWMSLYGRLITKGVALATNPTELSELMATLASAQRTLPGGEAAPETPSPGDRPHA